MDFTHPSNITCAKQDVDFSRRSRRACPDVRASEQESSSTHVHDARDPVCILHSADDIQCPVSNKVVVMLQNL